MPKITIRSVAFMAAIMIAKPAFGQEALKSPEAFSTIENAVELSQAIFMEMGKVFQHPRCINCHPRGNSPLQGDAMVKHKPPVKRGDEGGFGAPGMRCITCHGNENVEFTVGGRSIPGHQIWHLALAGMAWEGKSLRGICFQVKNPNLNGGRTLEELHEHNAEDGLVGWGWKPGAGREPAPGSQEIFGALTKAWIDSGAHCPPSS